MAVTEPYIPYNITVHLGAPDSYAQNVTVSFIQYIKNVASSEIYPTWGEPAIRANIYAQISFALNRIYTEYYRSRGYNFDITNNTAFDQKFINNREIFANIDAIVSEIFDTYIRRRGNIEPLAAKYCNGTTVTCSGMSQWGSQELAEQGYSDFGILQYYYGYDIELVYDTPIRNLTDSYPGYSLSLGSSGNSITLIQNALNRISQNYPAIPKIPSVDGIFGTQTQDAVIRFQQIFNLSADGIVGKATWYQIILIYGGVTRLSELDSEGSKLFDSSLSYPDAVQEGDQGEKVEITQYFLALISAFYDTVQTVEITGTFGEDTKQSVISFQQQFGLPETGIVDAETWNQMYDAFEGILSEVLYDEEIFPVTVQAYPGTPLQQGSQGEDVIGLQNYLNEISLVYTEITPVTPSGVFDDATLSAVETYQRLFNFPITGIVDRVVWNSIINTFKTVLSPATSRPVQYGGNTLQLGSRDD